MNIKTTTPIKDVSRKPSDSSNMVTISIENDSNTAIIRDPPHFPEAKPGFFLFVYVSEESMAVFTL